MPKTGNKNSNNNSVPTLAAYIAAQIANKRAAALDKSRNRTFPAVPLVERELTPEEIKVRNALGYAKINQLESELIKTSDNKKVADIKKQIDKEFNNLKKTTTLCEGLSCIYTATDNYGPEYRVSGNKTFAANPSKYGFKKIPNDSIQPSDLVQVTHLGFPSHAMIFDSKDEKGENLYNYSTGGYDEEAIRIKSHNPTNSYDTFRFFGTPADSTQWINDYKKLYGNQMKCGGRRKAQLGLDIQYGGRAIPISNNMVYFDGNSHSAGGIGVGNDLEVEGGEVGEKKGNNLRIFSAVPFLGGVSPAQLVMGGANPNKVFKAQEEFKDRNRINDDGTRYQIGGQKKSSSAIRKEADKNVPAYNRAVYSLVDPTMGYPTKKEAIGYAIGAGIKAMRNPNDMIYWVTDSVSDAAWRKRHGLSYDDKFLIPNEDGSVRLPKDREMEIPTDTTMLKNRIAANKKLAKRYPEGSEKRNIVDWALEVDGMALDSLRHTYKTGEPVTINEGAYNSRRLINNGELNYPGIMPHNVMQNYAIQYDKSKDKMNYWDTYNFNEFEWGVPGKPFEIRGSIPLKKYGGSKQDDTKTAALKRLRNRFAVNTNYNTNENVLPEVTTGDKKPKTFFEKVDDYADIAEKTLAIPNMALSGYSLIAPNPYTAVGAYLTGLANGGIDVYQGIRSAIKGDWFNAGKNAIDLGMSLVGLRALRNANKLNALDKSLDASGAPREYVTKMVGRGRGRTKATFTKEKNEAIKEAAVGYGMIPGSAAMSLLDTNKSRNKKEFGGNMIYTINGNVKNGLMSARPKAKLGKTVKINRGSYETVDEVVERYKQLYRIRYGKEPSKNDIERVAWTKSLENAVNNDNPNLITGYGPNVGLRGLNVSKIVSNANKGKQIARTQTTVRNKNVKSTSPKRQAINSKVSEAARAERQSQFDAWQRGEAFKASTMPTDIVAVNRPTISTGVRSGRRGRIDDIAAIERSQRSVDPLSSKPEFGVYDKAYAKKVNGKMNQFANALLASETGGIVVGSMTYDDIVGDTIYNTEQSKEKQIDSNAKSEIDKSVNPNIKVKSNSSSTTKVNNKNTNNDYISTTKPNTGESYIINPLTGEWIRNGVTETSEPSVEVTTKVNSRPSTTPRRGETKPTSSKAASKSTPTLQDNINQITRDAISRSIAPKIDLSKVEMPTFDVSQLGSKETKAAKAKLNTSPTGGSTESKEAPWIPQFNTISTGDWIGLGSNLAGHIASYITNNALLKRFPMPTKPIMAPAAKLKTRYNINPELSETRETELVNRSAVRRNSQSSNTSLAREQRIANEARNARNNLYGQKENIETQLINQDRLNRQSVMARNVSAYNDWLNKSYVAKNNQMLAKQQNLMSLINGIPMAVNNIIGNIESRQATNNTIKAMAAANPNVDGRLLGIGDYYSQRLKDGRVAIYDKNGKLKRIK